MAADSAMRICIVISFFSILCFLCVGAVEFQVGEEKGWVVPSEADGSFYNKWASKNRFRIGDSIVFKYKKDSVMLVSEEDYRKCNSAHPLFFSNDGDTMVKLDRPGPFYFISGVSGHCERGQKMIVKVLSDHQDEAESAPPSPPGSPSVPSDSSSSLNSPSSLPSMVLFLLSLLQFLRF